MGTAHAGTQDLQQSRNPTPGTPTFQQRHRSPPSQGMPVDTAGKGHAPGQSLRTPQPSTSEPAGRKCGGQEVLLQESFSSKNIAGLDANPVTPVPSKSSLCLECSFEDNTSSSIFLP